MKPHTKMTIDALVVESPPPALGVEVFLAAAGTEVGLEEDEAVAGFPVGAAGAPTPCGAPGGLAGCVAATATSVRNTVKQIAFRLDISTVWSSARDATFANSGSNFRYVPSFGEPKSLRNKLTIAARALIHIFSGKMPANSRNTHELFSFFECIVSVRDAQIRQLGKSMGGHAKCRTARSSSRKCLDHMTSKPSTQTLMFPVRASPLCASEVVKMQLL